MHPVKKYLWSAWDIRFSNTNISAPCRLHSSDLSSFQILVFLLIASSFCNIHILLDNLIDSQQLCLACKCFNKLRCLSLICWSISPIFLPANQTSLLRYSLIQVTVPTEVKGTPFPSVPILPGSCNLYLVAQLNTVYSSTYFSLPLHSPSSLGLIPTQSPIPTDFIR